MKFIQTIPHDGTERFAARTEGLFNTGKERSKSWDELDEDLEHLFNKDQEKETPMMPDNPTLPTNLKKRSIFEENSSEDDSESKGEKKHQSSTKKLAAEYESKLSLTLAELREDLKYGKETVPFLLLMKLMTSLWEGTEVTPEMIGLLRPNERFILSVFVAKKVRNTFDPKGCTHMIAGVINAHYALYKAKRNEENYKLVIKKAIKYLSKKLATAPDTLLNSKKETQSVSFFDHYFAQVCKDKEVVQQMGLAAGSHKELIKSFSSVIFNPKTVNPKYIANVAHSKPFIEDLRLYIHQRFCRDYFKSRFVKLGRILASIKHSIDSKTVDLNGLKAMIESNPRFKLPWYDKEIRRAAECVLRALDLLAPLPEAPDDQPPQEKHSPEAKPGHKKLKPK